MERVYFPGVSIDLCFSLAKGAVSAGSHVPVHGSAAGPPRPVEPAGTQPVRPGHHGRSMGEGSDSAQHTHTNRTISLSSAQQTDRGRKKESKGLTAALNLLKREANKIFD